MSLQIVYDLVKASEVPDAHAIEIASKCLGDHLRHLLTAYATRFSPDEAATLEKFL